MQVSKDISHDFAVDDKKNVGVKKALGSLLVTMQKVGKNSKGLVSDLVGSNVEESTTESMANVLTKMLKESDPCPFGYGCGGGDIDPATKAQVANILKGMIKNLSG